MSLIFEDTCLRRTAIEISAPVLRHLKFREFRLARTARNSLSIKIRYRVTSGDSGPMQPSAAVQYRGRCFETKSSNGSRRHLHRDDADFSGPRDGPI